MPDSADRQLLGIAFRVPILAFGGAGGLRRSELRRVQRPREESAARSPVLPASGLLLFVLLREGLLRTLCPVL